MSFVQTIFLIGTASVAIPIVVHLLSRWQVRKLELGTMRFLREIIHEGAHRRHIRRWFLLLTRSLLMLLLAFLFARPYLAAQTRHDGNVLRIYLIDRSASMGMPGQNGRLIDDAVTAAIEDAADLGTDARILWAWFDDAVEPLETTDSEQPATIQTLRHAPSQSVVGGTNYLAALRWARDRLDAFPTSQANVVLVTDLQQSGLGTEPFEQDSLDFPMDVSVTIIDVGRPAANNLAITNISASVESLGPQQDAEFSVTMFNYGALPFEDIPVAANAFNGVRTVRLKKSLNIQNGEAEELSYNFGKLERGIWQITVVVDAEDDLANDNLRYSALEVVTPANILVLDSGASDSGAAAASFFLVAALNEVEFGNSEFSSEEAQVLPTARFRAEPVFLEEDFARMFHAGEVPLVVVADAGTLPAGMIRQLGDYVESGGKALLFAGDGLQEQSHIYEEAGLAPGEMKEPISSGVMPFRMTRVDTANSMMAPFADPQHGDLSRLAFRKVLPIHLGDQTTALAHFDQNLPAVTQHHLGSGRVVWFLSSADSSWSNWTTSALYLPVVQQMAADLLNLTGEGVLRYRTTGERLSTLISSPQKSRETNEQLAPRQPGFHQENKALYVVNGSPAESDPARTDPATFADYYGLTIPDQETEVVAERVVEETRHELWPWLASALFVLTFTEFSLANRTSA